MNDICDQIVDLSSKFLRDAISMADFRAGFAGLYVQARNAREDAANGLASKIIGPLSEFGRHHRGADSFRRELAAAIPLATGQ